MANLTSRDLNPPPVRKTAFRQVLTLVLEHPQAMIAFLAGCLPTYAACSVMFDTLPRALVFGIALCVQAVLTLLGAPVWMLFSQYEFHADLWAWGAALADVSLNAGAIFYLVGTKLVKIDVIHAIMDTTAYHGALPAGVQFGVSCLFAAFLALAPVKLYYRGVGVE